MKPTKEYTNAIRSHAQRFAHDARGSLDLEVPGCPGWKVRDAVSHLRQVHRFWGTIVEGRYQEPPDVRVDEVGDEVLIGEFLDGATWMCDVLARTDQSESVWTWAPSQHDVAFVTRHQYQEMAVHHWDVARIAGVPIELDPVLCADAVDEFLHFSMSSPDDPADPPRPALDGPLVVRAIDTGDVWTVRDATPGQVVVERGAVAGAPVIGATAADLLVWLYRRIELDVADDARALGDRLQALSFTD